MDLIIKIQEHLKKGGAVRIANYLHCYIYKKGTESMFRMRAGSAQFQVRTAWYWLDGMKIDFSKEA